MRKRHGRVKLADVAQEAGVSVMTASNALAGRVGVSETTRRRILRTATQLGYRRSRLASWLSSNKTHVLAALTYNLDGDPCSVEIVKAFEIAANAAGRQVLLHNIIGPSDGKARINALLEWHVEGIMTYGGFDLELLKTVRKTGAAAVEFGFRSGVAGVDSVVLDYEPGAHAALSHLKALGHQKIGLIVGVFPGETELHALTKSLLSIYPPAIQDMGMTHTVTGYGNWEIGGGEEAMSGMLAGRPLPSAIIAANDLMAIGAINACWKQGLRVPEDISIIGMDDIAYAAAWCPPLTTLALPKREIGREMLRLLLREHSNISRTVSFAQELVIRQSTGPAPAK